MADQLTLISSDLDAAAEHLHAAACAIDGVRGGTEFAFESLTGLARAVGGFLRHIDVAAEHLSEATLEGAHSVVMLGEQTSAEEQQISNALGSSPASTNSVSRG